MLEFIRIQDILSSITDMVFVFDREGRFIYWQAPYEKLYLPPETFIGKRVEEVMPPHVCKPFEEAFNRVKNNEVCEFEYWLELDEKRWFSAKLSPIFVENEFRGCVAVVRDITERKITEERLKESEEKYKELFDNSLDAIIITDLEGKIIEVNSGFENITGYSRDEVKGRSYTEFVPKEYAEEIFERYNKALREDKNIHNIQFEFFTKKGEKRVAEGDVSLIKRNGKVVAFQGNFRDITERKTMEEELKRRGKILEAISVISEHLMTSPLEDALNKVVEVLGKATNVSRVYIFRRHDSDNEIFVSQTHEWVNEGIIPQIDNEELQNFPMYMGGFERWVKKFNKGSHVSGLIREFPETERPILEEQSIKSILVIPIIVNNKWWGFIGFDECNFEREWLNVEVDALKSAANLIASAIERWEKHNQLKLSEERYRKLFEQNPIAITLVDKDGRYIDVNEEYVKLTGYKKEEIIGRHFTEFVVEEDRPLVVEYNRKRMRNEGAPSHYEYRLKRKDGKVRDIEIKIIKLPGDKTLACRIDVTDKKNMEKKLKDSEEMFRKLAEKSLVGIYLIQDGVFRYVNPKMAELWGYGVEELIGRSPLEFIHPEDREIVRRNLERRVRGEIESINYRLRMIRKDGEVRYNEVFGTRIMYKGKPAVIGTLIDITEQEKNKKRLEEYKRFYENAQDLFFILDRKGRFLDVNPKYAEMLGYTKEELINHTTRRLTLPEEVSVVRENFRKVMRGEKVRYKIRAISKDGALYTVEIVLWPIYKGHEIVGAEGIVRDVTETERLNKLLRLINNINNLIVKESNKQKLLERVCKELSFMCDGTEVAIFLVENGKITPAVVGDRRELDREKLKCKLIKEAIERKTTISEETRVCSNCDVKNENIQQVLFIPMMSDGQVVGVIRFCLTWGKEMSDEEINLLETVAGDLAFKIKTIELEELKKRAYEQIEQNIEQFAILADHIRNPLAGILGLTEMRIDDEGLQLQFKEFVNRIEEVIRKLDEGWLESEIVRDFLRGELRRWTKGDEIECMDKKVNMTESLVKNGKILIVEDDVGLAEIFSLMLSDYDVIIATNGEEAVQIYETYKPDIVLMDIALPGMSGIDATKKMIEIDPEAKIVGVTGFGRRWGKDLLASGALEILNKPFTKKDLLGVVERYINR